MFVIIVPVCMAPALAILYWADRKAKRVGGESSLMYIIVSVHRRQVRLTESLSCHRSHFGRRFRLETATARVWSEGYANVSPDGATLLVNHRRIWSLLACHILYPYPSAIHTLHNCSQWMEKS